MDAVNLIHPPVHGGLAQLITLCSLLGRARCWARGRGAGGVGVQGFTLLLPGAVKGLPAPGGVVWEQTPRLCPLGPPGWWLLLLTPRLPAQSDLSTLEMPLPLRLGRCPWGKPSTIHSLPGQRPLWALPCGLYVPSWGKASSQVVSFPFR